MRNYGSIPEIRHPSLDFNDQVHSKDSAENAISQSTVFFKQSKAPQKTVSLISRLNRGRSIGFGLPGLMEAASREFYFSKTTVEISSKKK